MFQNFISAISSNNPTDLQNLIEGVNIWPIILTSAVGIILFFSVFAVIKKMIPNGGQSADA